MKFILEEFNKFVLTEKFILTEAADDKDKLADNIADLHGLINDLIAAATNDEIKKAYLRDGAALTGSEQIGALDDAGFEYLIKNKKAFAELTQITSTDYWTSTKLEKLTDEQATKINELIKTFIEQTITTAKAGGDLNQLVDEFRTNLTSFNKDDKTDAQDNGDDWKTKLKNAQSTKDKAKVWNDYFTQTFGKDANAVSSLGQAVKIELDYFGFDPTKNPFVKFLKRAICTMHLPIDANHYGVIHNEYNSNHITKEDLVPDDNVDSPSTRFLFLAELYNQSLSDMEEYIEGCSWLGEEQVVKDEHLIPLEDLRQLMDGKSKEKKEFELNAIVNQLQQNPAKIALAMKFLIKNFGDFKKYDEYIKTYQDVLTAADNLDGADKLEAQFAQEIFKNMQINKLTDVLDELANAYKELKK